MSELLTNSKDHMQKPFSKVLKKIILLKNVMKYKKPDTAVNDENIKQILSNDSYDNKYKSNLLSDILKENIDENFSGLLSVGR